MKDEIKALRLIIGAAEAEAKNTEIAPEFVPQIEQARVRLQTMNGGAVVNALLLCRKGGLNLALDVSNKVRVTGDTSKPISAGRLRTFK